MITLKTGWAFSLLADNATDVHVTAAWADHDHTPVSNYVPDLEGFISAGIGITPVVAAPSSFPRRTVKAAAFRATASVTLSVGLDNGVDFIVIVGAALLAGDTLAYEDAHGWRVLRAGAVVTVGSQGATGATGPQGAPGVDGLDGAEGPPGPPGATGTQGAQGPAGPTGATGDPGPQGPPGADGADGLDGVPGLQGAQGPAGSAGPTGATGPQGPPGQDGIDGQDGAPGQPGAQGPAGADGADGAQGAAGPQGPPGPPGADGADGEPGPPGPAGATGPQGPAGGGGTPPTDVTVTMPFAQLQFDTVSVVDAAITLSSVILVHWGVTTPEDENNPEDSAVFFTAAPASGSFTLRMYKPNDFIGGAYKIRYQAF